MKTFAAIMAMATLATAVPADTLNGTLVARQNTDDCPAVDRVVCETSGGSPQATDCMFYVPYPENYAGGCAQPHGSGCFTESELNTCEIALCQDGRSNSQVACFEPEDAWCIGHYITMLVDECEDGDGRVGGYVNIPNIGDNYINVVLAHT